MISAFRDRLGSLFESAGAMIRSERTATDGHKQDGIDIDTLVQTDGGVTTSSQTAPGADTDTIAESFPLNFHDIMNRVKTGLFVVDAEGEVILWNTGMTRLTGSTEQEARDADAISEVWYHDDRRSLTLADKVLESPESAHLEYDVEKLDRVGYTLYEDQSTFADADGETRHITFSAAPLYDDGEFAGVVELVEDRTEDVLRQHRLEDLVSELTETMKAFQRGDFGAKATFDGGDHIDEDLLIVVDALNEMGAQLEGLVSDLSNDVAQRTAELRTSAGEVVEASEQIGALTDEQAEQINQLDAEVETLSATIEEISSTSDEVAANAETAVDRAKEGRESAREVKDVMHEVADAGDEVATDVEGLKSRIDEIDEIVEVINDIADQTNMLALNASIEAARAGQAGEGFAVVADEVKSLAEESQTRASEIEAMVESIQADTTDTVESLEATNESVQRGIEKVQSAMHNFEEIVDGIEETAHGIEQVSDATDEQATSAEEIASMLNNTVETTNEVSEQVDDIIDATQEQTRKVDDIEMAIKQLASQVGSDR